MQNQEYVRGYEYSLYLPFSSDKVWGGNKVLCLKNTWNGLTKKISHFVFILDCRFFSQILFLLAKLVLSNINDDMLLLNVLYNTYLLLNFAHEVTVCCVITEIYATSIFFFEVEKKWLPLYFLRPQICQTPAASKGQASNPYKKSVRNFNLVAIFQNQILKKGPRSNSRVS